MDQQLIADVNLAEGRRLTAYRDTRGFWTAGVGHKLPVGQDYTNIAYTPAQSDSWLASDLDVAEAQAARLDEWSMLNTPCRCNALVECVFNLGLGHWIIEFPHTRAALKVQDWNTAYTALLDSPEWISEVGFGRVNRLANYFLTGVYPLVNHGVKR